MARPFRLDRVDAARNFLIESAEHDHVFVFSALAEDSKSAAAQRAAARAEAPSAGETAPVQAALAARRPGPRSCELRCRRGPEIGVFLTPEAYASRDQPMAQVLTNHHLLPSPAPAELSKAAPTKSRAWSRM